MSHGLASLSRLPEDLYEDWAAARREHARLLYQELLARLTQLYDARGQHQRAIEQIRVMLASDPTNEEAHALKSFAICPSFPSRTCGHARECLFTAS